MACYCNDLIVIQKYPGHVFDSIRGKGLPIKEMLAPDYFLGGDFERVKELKTNSKILKWVSKVYVKCMMDNFKNNFVFVISKQHAAMPPDYKPNLDTT